MTERELGSRQLSVNRAERRRLKRALKLPYTPSREFAEKYLTKMADQVSPVEKPVRIQRPSLARAFEGQDGAE